MGQMMKNFKTVLAGAAVSAMAISSAQAGGFERGTANLDALFGDRVQVDAGWTFVNPGREYDKVEGLKISGGAPAPLTGGEGEVSKSYNVPYFSLGGRLGGNTNCVGSYAQPWGVNSENNDDLVFHEKVQRLETDEYAFTCGVGMDLSRGRLIFIGGVFMEELHFTQSRNFEEAFGLAGFGDSLIKVSSEAWGWRAGLGYEIPEIALKASLIYRSHTRHDVEGDFINTPFFLLRGGLDPRYSPTVFGASASGEAELPQSVELRFQSGVNQSTLVFGSVKWTDWSVLERVGLNDGITGEEFTGVNVFFRDGWKVNLGVARRLTDRVAASASVTWDKGVSTGWNVYSDTWTFALGTAFNLSEAVQLRLGGAAIYFTEGERTKNETGPTALPYTVSAPAEWGYAGSAQLVAKF